MRLRAARGVLSITLCLCLAACSSTTISPTPAPAPAPAAQPTSPVSPEAAAAVDAARQDAAAHLGISPDQLNVAQVDPREWSDASLGCPQADQQYSQVITPGFFIVLTGGGRHLEYHTDTRARVTLCRES
jgi:hypothetical protein